MEAVIMKSYCPSDLPPEEVIDLFFRNYSSETMWVNTFYLFKCWTTNSCGLKEKLPNEELALFLDQLIDLVAAAYTLHQANRVSGEEKKDQANG
ncbi:hypothetical protein ACPPVU_12175 [Mucilaginibacter sp. McL0603]|uniref:hypothetical protein n=1 Tax=Mucilaginibacter sp. McL0603 TaxID=3415670 RepID=UPI003CF85A9C